MIRPIVAALLLGELLIGTAHAESPRQATCGTANTEAEMYQCFSDQLQRTQARMQAAYKTLIERYKQNGTSPGRDIESQDRYLEASQAAWIEYRDKSCDFETYESITGTGFGTIYTACLLEKTQARAEYLQQQVDQP